MSRYDVVVVGAGLGGLTSAAILARAGRKVLVVERGNSVGGAASSYKVGDLFIEASLHETSGPKDPADPKHTALTRAGVLDKVQWVPTGVLHEIRGGPLKEPFVLPHGFGAARAALLQRFPESSRGIKSVLRDMEKISLGFSTAANGNTGMLKGIAAAVRMLPAFRTWSCSLSDRLDRSLGSNEAAKCAISANLSYYHDDPATLWWVFYAIAQGSYIRSGGSFVHSGTQRLSSALARVVKGAGNGSDVLVRRVVTGIETSRTGRATAVTHTAKDGSDPQRVETMRVISNAAPDIVAAMIDKDNGERLRKSYAHRAPSISLFGLTLGLSRPPSEFGLTHYSTQLLPDWMTRFADYKEGTALLAAEPGEKMPPLAIANYSAIESGVPTKPHYIVSAIGPDRLTNWEDDRETYEARKKRWQAALIAYLDRTYPGLAGAVVASSFNTAKSMRSYLNAPNGSAYGFAPSPPSSLWRTDRRSPRTVIPGLFLASAYGGFGGYSGVIQSAAVCADEIIAETR